MEHQKKNKKKMKTKKHWIEKQREDAEKVFAPKIDYDEEYDILSINWLPQLKYDHSIETKSGFVFDITKPEEEIKGIEIFDFMKKIKGKSPKPKWWGRSYTKNEVGE